MLNKLRESAHGIFGKILLAILVLSFGIWGIGDIFRQGGGISAVATVDGTPVSVPDFQRALHNKQQELQIKLGKAYNPDMLRKFGIDRVVRDELVNNQLMVSEADTLGLVVEDDEIIKNISHNPAFQDKNGNFDKQIYLATLKHHGLAESYYVSDIRKNMTAGLLADSITASVVVPKELLQAVYKAHEEQRSANIMIVPSSVVKQAPVPTEKEIKLYYDAHNRSFLTPEYRSVSYIDLKLSDMQSRIEVPEEEIKRVYDERIQDFHKPERRQVEQMLFEKEADAAAMAEKIKQGGHFTDMTKTANILNKGKTSLGLVAKQDVPAEDGDEIFALKENAATKALKSDFGWHIFYVSKIVPEGTETLAEVKPEIIKDLKAAKANETLLRLGNQIEDDMAGGISLEDAAKKNGYQLGTVKQITHEGKFADGKMAFFPAYDNFLDAAFSTNEKEHSQPVQVADGSFFIVRVDNVTPEHAKLLTEVKENIVTILKGQKIQELLNKEAENIDAQLRAGKNPGITLASFPSGNIKRDAEITEGLKVKLPRKLVAELFSIEPHGFTHAYKAADDEYFIASLNTIIPAPDNADPKLLETLERSLKTSLENEVMSHYLTYLRSKHSISINEAAFRIRDDEGSE